MTTTTYDAVLAQVRQLTPEERERLHEELRSIRAADARRAPISPLVAALEALEPIRPEALDAMERAIEEDCEGVTAIDRRARPSRVPTE